MNTHYYNLQPNPFALIKSGHKTVEMRLNDERRKLLRVGDIIIFTNAETQENLAVTVLKLAAFKDFNELYSSFAKEELGYLTSETADPLDMEKYYTKTAIIENGVLAITIVISETKTFDNFKK